MFDKLDTYNLIANLIPGAALVCALHFSGIPAPSPEKIGVFLLAAFVLGAAINRLGSLILDPLLRLTGFLDKKNYGAYVDSEKQDEKLQTLVANSGLYRTFVMAGLTYLLILAIDFLRREIGIETKIMFIFSVVIGILVFLFAFRKEDKYIQIRMKNSTDAKVIENSSVPE